MTTRFDQTLETILGQYKLAFSTKSFYEESVEEDDLMQVFGLTQATKAENKQYWGRELGMCWQRLVVALCREHCPNFAGSIRDGNDEICDLVIGKIAIDTKYRIGSGDSGTLKKFRQYGVKLQAAGYMPLLLILRNDNLPQAIKACQSGGWEVITGNNSFAYLEQQTGFDLQRWLQVRKRRYPV